MIFFIAAGRPNQPIRSISGNCFFWPERGGHSISNKLLENPDRSKLASKVKPCTVLPLFCRTGCSATKGPCAVNPVSSLNSRSVLEFAERAGQQIVRPYQPFGNGPGAVVLARPVWPARMRQQHLDLVASAIGQQACADVILACHAATIAEGRPTGPPFDLSQQLDFRLRGPRRS